MRRGYIREIFLKRPLPEESYLSALPALAPLLAGQRLSFDAPVTFLVGENGTGKSTLLEAIAVACGFNAEGGSRNFSFSTRATHSSLWEYLTVSRSRYPRDGFFLPLQNGLSVPGIIFPGWIWSFLRRRSSILQEGLTGSTCAEKMAKFM